MADRIFINKDSGQYSDKELNRIDWSQVRDGMFKVRQAVNAGKNLNPFGMVTGILDTRVAQFDSDFEEDMPQAPSDSSRIMMIADAIATGQEIDTEDAKFGMDNAEEIARAADMSPEEVSSMLSDYIGINPIEDESADGEFAGDMGDVMASRIAKKKLPAALEKFKFKGKDSKNEEKENEKDEETNNEEDKDEDKDEEADAMLRKGDERKANRKIVFTDASQLSASAVEAAKNAGDEELLRATLAARASRREVIGQMAAKATLEQLTREAKTKRRTTASKAEKPKEVTANVKNQKTTNGEDFVAPTELKSSQKSVFASKARELGFPEAYIEHMLNTRSANTVTEDEVRSIAEGPGKYTEKAERVASMIREAKLDDANKSRIIKFWVEELGYPADYINKMVEDYKS